MIDNSQANLMRARFRGFLPIIVDVETSGVDPNTNALLEVCMVTITMDKHGVLKPEKTIFEHIIPFEGATLDEASLAFNGIDPFQPLRMAKPEPDALNILFKPIFEALKNHKCSKAVLVGPNAWFDLLFIKKAIERHQIKSPFHAFTCFDTASLSGLVYGQTVLAKAMYAAGIHFDVNEAHSAIYDAEKTAELFCAMVNLWKDKSYL